MALHREWRNLPDGKFWRQQLPDGGLLELRRLEDNSLEVELHSPADVMVAGSLAEQSAESLLQWLDRSGG